MRYYIVTDCWFNQANYPSLIGKKFTEPPGYAIVLVVDE